MASTKITDLTPYMQTLYAKFKEAMDEASLPFKVTCTARTYEEQQALYAQGRSPLDETNKLRMATGLPKITAAENKRKVTWTMKSKHLVKDSSEKARAFDIVLMSDNRVHWDIKVDVNKNLKPDYLEAAEIGEAVGLKVGAKFSTPDYPHYEEPDEELNTVEETPEAPANLSVTTSLPVPTGEVVGFFQFLKALISAFLKGSFIWQ